MENIWKKCILFTMIEKNTSSGKMYKKKLNYFIRKHKKDTKDKLR